ncbi:MAG: sodium-dependent transporter [Myxococcota bacterium]
MKDSTTSHPQWTSRLGFILTSAGAAVGFGNLQRFPQMVSEHGGGAFLLLYLACVLAFGLPLMLAEFALGRAGRADPITSFAAVAPRHKRWRFAGALGVLTAFCILSYYSVICTWTIVFTKEFVTGNPTTLEQIAADPTGTFPYLVIFYFISSYIVFRGLNRGLEKFSTITMPILVIIQLILVVRVLLLPNSLAGLSYYLRPDFSKLTSESWLYALSQAFFSLCIGEAVLITYGGYTKKDRNLPQSAFYISLFDTAVAFLSGLIIFPALFATGQQLRQGTGLVYNTIPAILRELPLGAFFQASFFAILAIAGLTTCIALLQTASHTLRKVMHWNRTPCVFLVGFLSFFLSIPSLYAKGGSPWLSSVELCGARGFYDVMDFVWGGLGMVITGLLTTLFVGWVWGADNAVRELSRSSPLFVKISPLWRFHIKWSAPVMIALILVSIFS